LQTHLGAPLPTDKIRKPEKPPPQKAQAVALEPALHLAIDQALGELSSTHEHFTVMVAAQVQLMAVLRFRHLQRSRPLKLKESLLVGYCEQGKARRHQLGFQWACPLYGPSGFDVGRAALDQWRRFRPGNATSFQPLACDAAGNQLSIASFQTAMRSILLHHFQVDNASLFTTYSLRRCYPTVAGIHRASADEQDALGDWLTVQGTVMRVRYQNQCLEEAAAAKLRQSTLLQWATQHHSEHLSWEVLRVFMDAERVAKAGEKVATQLLHDQVVEQVDGDQQPKARFTIRHLSTRVRMGTSSLKRGSPCMPAEPPCLPVRPETGPSASSMAEPGSAPTSAASEEVQQSWLATSHKGDALVHLTSKEGQPLCKHRQKSPREIKRAVAQGASVSELPAFGWGLSHICERCQGLAPVGALAVLREHAF
jgi:hypothetical protein